MLHPAMMCKMFSKQLYAGVLFLLFSCETPRYFSNADILIAQPEVSTSGQTWIRNNLELDRLVQIETTESYLMGDLIRRVILHKDKLIILDKRTHTVFVVNAHTGKVEIHINRRGRGPGESRFIIDIAFDCVNEQILVYNDYQNLIYFSLDGEFLKQEKVNDKLYTNILYDNDNLIFYKHAMGDYSYPFLIDIFNLSNRTWKTLGAEHRVKFDIQLPNPFIVKSKNIWFVPVLDMGLHLLDGDTIKIPYGLDVRNPLTNEILKKYQRSDDHRVFSSEIRDRGILWGIQGVRETENYIVFSTNIGIMMMDKRSFEIHATMWMFDEYLGINHSSFKYLAHDGNDNRIMFIVDHNQWLGRNPTEQDIPEHLKTQIETVKLDEKIESNPILVFYKEK